MAIIKVTIKNGYLHNITEEFVCSNVDISILDEIDYCVEECVGQYLEMHEDVIHTLDASWDQIADACHYTIEEVFEHEL